MKIEAIKHTDVRGKELNYLKVNGEPYPCSSALREAVENGNKQAELPLNDKANGGAGGDKVAKPK